MEIAEIIGTSSNAMSPWKSGEGFPTVNILLRLAEYFGVKIDALFFVDLEQEKRDSSHPDFKIGDTTFGEISAEVRKLWEEVIAIKEKQEAG